MTLDHERVVLDALLGQLEVAQCGREEDTRDNRRRRRPESSTEGDLVRDVDADDGGREGEVVREEDVEGDASDQVLVRIQGCFSGALSDVAEEHLRLCRWREGHAESEVQGEGETQDVESGSDIGGRRRNTDDPLKAAQCGQRVVW